MHLAGYLRLASIGNVWLHLGDLGINGINVDKSHQHNRTWKRTNAHVSECSMFAGKTILAVFFFVLVKSARLIASSQSSILLVESGVVCRIPILVGSMIFPAFNPTFLVSFSFILNLMLFCCLNSTPFWGIFSYFSPQGRSRVASARCEAGGMRGQYFCFLGNGQKHLMMIGHWILGFYQHQQVEESFINRSWE